jgi:hypothetical protein
MPSMTGIPFDRNPVLAQGLQLLSWWLEDNHYSATARDAIVRHTSIAGTPTGAAMLEPADESEATEAFVQGLKDISYDDPTWDREDMCLDAELLSRDEHPWPIPAQGDDDEDGLAVDIIEPRYTAQDGADYERCLRDREIMYGYD